MATERLKVILEMAAGQYKREAREAATATGKISSESKSATGNVASLGSTLRSAAVTGGVIALGRGLFSAVEAAEQSASALANTEQIIKQTGGSANVTADDIVELSRELSALTGTQDEVVQEGLNVLLTFKNLRNEVGDGNDVFDRTAALMLDIGAVMGTDTSSAALQLGKALNDPVSQMGALSRAGLTFNSEQKETIKTLADSGNLLEAQKIILSELETQLGGTAAASADATDKIGSALGELGEGVGTLLLPVVETAATELQRIVGLIDELDRLAAVTGQDRQSATLLAGALVQLGERYELVAEKGGAASDTTGRFAQEARSLIETAGLSVVELQKVRDGLDFLVESMGLSSEQADVLAQILDQKLNSELARLTDLDADRVLRGRFNPALEETIEVLTHTGDALEELPLDQTRNRIRNGEMLWQGYGVAADDAADATDRAAGSLRDFFDLMDSRFDSLRGLRDAQEEVADKQDALTEAYDEFGANSPEYLAALDDLSIANQDLRTAQRRLIEEGGLTRAEFIQQQVQMGLTYEQALLLADQYDDLFTPRHVTNTITNVITNQMRGGGGGPVVDRALAGGGSAIADNTYLTGEAGRELFAPHTDGYVFNNQSTERILASLAALNGATANPSPSYSKETNINLNGPINGVEEVIGAVQRASGLAAMVDLAEVNAR